MLLMNMSGCCSVVMVHVHVNTDPSQVIEIKEWQKETVTHMLPRGKLYWKSDLLTKFTTISILGMYWFLINFAKIAMCI